MEKTENLQTVTLTMPELQAIIAAELAMAAARLPLAKCNEAFSSLPEKTVEILPAKTSEKSGVLYFDHKDG